MKVKRRALAYGLGMIAAGILLAWLTYRFVERPIRFGKLVVETKKVRWLCVVSCSPLLWQAVIPMPEMALISDFPKFIHEILKTSKLAASKAGV